MVRLYDSTVMNINEMIRNKLFFSLDRVLGKGIYKQVTSVEEDIRNPRIEEKLNNIINHARDTVPYYNAYKNSNDISQMPVVNKSIIRKDSQSFISSLYDKNELIKVTTSGSSGTPMEFYRDSNKRIRQIAEVIYLGIPVKYYFGMKHGFIRATHPKSRLNLMLQNEIHIDPTKLSDENLEKIRAEIKEMKCIIGFPSTLYEIALYCERKGDTPEQFNMIGIICTAEPLLDKQRAAIQRVFGCPIQVRYAAEELGLIAVQNPGEPFYRINQASFYVEILKLDSDFPCEEGEEGRIVITDLEAKAMPLIRYDTGDLGVIKTEEISGERIVTLSSISGRKIEMLYSPSGEKISPFSINVKMKDVKGVIKFQFIQKDKNNYTMKVVADEEHYNETELLRILHGILGENAMISIEMVDMIKPLASGKTAYIVNEYIRKD
ncbi:hypothetical protein AB1K89_09290 [Sporosarcina sp. 179-K 8C2 HS]|uniref:hypothetical protein n=1 Tax=Sporosarcina sp. 179-K 8C2 HS TaxID=3142387 RepID=UPI0039A0F110